VLQSRSVVSALVLAIGEGNEHDPEADPPSTPEQTERRRLPECPDGARVFLLAVRLTRGEVLDLADEHGRSWRASATTLELTRAGGSESDTIVEGCAADVAIEVIRRNLRTNGT
jgi:hypothetical protein